MTTLVFDVAGFRVAFPAFASPVTYSDPTLLAYWDAATCYITAEDSPCLVLSGVCRARALDLMTAHLTAISDMIAAGQKPSLVQSATVDKVTVSQTPPPLRSAWQWWLMTTPYGMQLWALLAGKAVGGLYIGGNPERSAIRRVGGGFNSRGRHG